MGLISKEVEVILNSKNIKHYEDLGYKMPRYENKYNKGKLSIKQGTKIIVKVEDLPKGSHTNVKVKCNCCGKEYELSYQKYLKGVHEDNTTYCKNCANTVLFTGKNHPNYNPNKTEEERIKGRAYPRYTEFIKKVLVRDNYTCQCCGQEIHGNSEVHHLDSYNWCIEKRTDETNGITLCDTCHKNFHSIYGKGNNTKEQFEEWIGHAIGELEKYYGKLPTTRKIYCIEEDKIYDSALELAKEFGVDHSRVYAVCNHRKRAKSVKGKHLLWLDEYEQMSKEDLQKYLEWCKPSKNRISGKMNKRSA